MSKRLFGNENSTRHAAPANESEAWESISAMSRASAALESSKNGSSGLFPSRPSFPYPETVTINFANAQVSELWIPVSGFAVSFFDSTNLTDVVNVRFATAQGDQSGKPLPFRPGHALGLGDFTWLGLTWAAIPGAIGTLAILPRGVLLDDNR